LVGTKSTQGQIKKKNPRQGSHASHKKTEGTKKVGMKPNHGETALGKEKIQKGVKAAGKRPGQASKKKVTGSVFNGPGAHQPKGIGG